jgi:rSAM/selenodomain-associated transferase 1
MQTVLGIFTKAPIPGKVKTRTHSLLSPEEAASLHRALVSDTLQMSRGVASRRILFVAEGLDHPFIQEMSAREGIEVVAQEGSDLGARMQNAMRYADVSTSAVCLIGTDSPHVPVSSLRDAFVRLQQNTLVLGPANDLGYYLIGLRGDAPSALFDSMKWGTDEVLPTTLQRAEALSLSYSLLPFWYDIDTPQDLQFLARHMPALIREDSSICPSIREFLRGVSLL